MMGASTRKPNWSLSPEFVCAETTVAAREFDTLAEVESMIYLTLLQSWRTTTHSQDGRSPHP